MNTEIFRSKKSLLLLGGVVALLAAGGTLAARGNEQAGPAGPMQDPMMEGMDMGGKAPSAAGSIRLTADQIRSFGVTFDSVEQRIIDIQVRTVGIVTFDETRVAQVAPKFGGFVEKLYVDFTGKRVRAGEPLLEIYSPELVSAQEELLLAAELDESLGQSPVPGVTASSSKLAEVARRRLRLWDITEPQIEQILETRNVRKTLTLFAPVSGVVVNKAVTEGQAISAGETLYTIADLSRVWVEADLREQDAGSVTEGSDAVVELSAFPGQPLKGQVEYVYPTLENESRTLRARIAIPNRDGRIKPGMYANVRFSTPEGAALTVPRSAVLYTGDRQIAFIDAGNGELMPQDVEVGRSAGEYTEILSGLEPGQRVVTSAQFLLDSESNLAQVMKSMMGMMGSSDLENMDMGGMDMSNGSMQMAEPDGTDGMKGMEMQGADVQGMPMPEGKE